ncbi:hypothetical protein GW916_05700 [bacterium]|nr:hypothetical protein [bacterium]
MLQRKDLMIKFTLKLIIATFWIPCFAAKGPTPRTYLNEEAQSFQLSLLGTKDQILDEVVDLLNLQWRYLVEDEESCKPETPLCNEAGACELNVTACLPTAFQESLGQKFRVPGPNSFSFALKVSGLYGTHRKVNADEFKIFTDSICKRIEDSSKVVPGDIGVFESNSGEPTHAYVVLSKNLGIQNPNAGNIKTWPIQIRNRSDIESTYDHSPQCKGDVGTSVSEEFCKRSLHYLRCESSKTEDLVTFLEHKEKIEELEFKVVSLMSQSDLGSEESRKFLFDIELTSTNLTIYLDNHLNSLKLSEKEMSYMRLQIKNIDEQILTL